MERSDSIVALAEALAKAQANISPAAKDATNPHFRRKYADLASIWEVARKPLNDQGLSVVQTPESIEGGGMRLRTMVLHSSGEFLASSIDLAYDPASMQSLGSAITYARRYALSAMVGIVAEEDDDGQSASRPAPAVADHFSPNVSGKSDSIAPVSDDGHRSPAPVGPPARTSSGGRGDHPPRSGSALYRWLKDQEDVHGVGLVKYIDGWARLQDFPRLMKEWSGEQAGLAHAEAVRKLSTLAAAA